MEASNATAAASADASRLDASSRTRNIERRLGRVQKLPEGDAPLPLEPELCDPS